MNGKPLAEGWLQLFSGSVNIARYGLRGPSSGLRPPSPIRWEKGEYLGSFTRGGARRLAYPGLFSVSLSGFKAVASDGRWKNIFGALTRGGCLRTVTIRLPRAIIGQPFRLQNGGGLRPAQMD